ncbi:hypothetical protein [Luteolibacter marinus]|uniref:hypothetical protein n=1 Tax=Luteolibacter marinus TaxID=2776705 RepID=UPI001869215D|nr:hypothetical protein [Luteolibacter marinus]
MAYPTIVQPGINPTLVWSIDLPPNAGDNDFTFFIRQEVLPDGATWDSPVGRSGETLSHYAVDPGGARFELWAVETASAEATLLDQTVAGSYLPIAKVEIRSEDPYRVLPRTRADRPFHVDVIVSGLLGDPEAPASSKSVTMSRHVQSYGTTGTGSDLDRSQATLLSTSSLAANGTTTFTYALPSVPGDDKARGEERLTISTQPDEYFPESVMDSQFIQIWPVADGGIGGISQGQAIGAELPQLTLTLNDLYPSSTTFAQVYKGRPQEGVTGTIVPGSTVTIDDSVPADRVVTVDDYGSVFDSGGLWTMELVTQTPFGTDRLACVSFTVHPLGVTLETWRQAYFGSSDNTGDGADLNDFDHDGIPNLIEYAFALDPQEGSSNLLPAPHRSASDCSFDFTAPAGISDVIYGAEWSTTLLPESWTSIADSGVPPGHHFSVPTGDKQRLYLRLKVTVPE